MPKRTGSPFDVLLDMCGAVTCHLMLFAFFGSLLELASTTSPAVLLHGKTQKQEE